MQACLVADADMFSRLCFVVVCMGVDTAFLCRTEHGLQADRDFVVSTMIRLVGCCTTKYIVDGMFNLAASICKSYLSLLMSLTITEIIIIESDANIDGMCHMYGKHAILLYKIVHIICNSVEIYDLQ
jgi:hypothetical protein